MSFTTKSLITSLVAGLAIAAPAVPVEDEVMVAKRQMTIPQCYTQDIYSNVKQGKPYYTKPVRVSGHQCSSLKESNCQLGEEASHSV